MISTPCSQLLPNLKSHRPLIIAGPCSAETQEQVLQTAHQLAEQGVQIFRAGVWKPRTKPGGFEGVGVEALGWLQMAKQQTGMAVATEVANREHVEAALKAGIDMLWIGARTTANPFAIQEIADALRGEDIPVLVKNPLSPDIELWIGALERLRSSGITRLGAIHRGFSGVDMTLFRNNPMWAIPIELHRRMPSLPMFCDPSHIGGSGELVAPICQQAMELHFDGLMIEAHCSPQQAWSDSAQQITPTYMAEICRGLTIREANVECKGLENLRHSIDQLDDQLMELLERRMGVAREIGLFKKRHNMAVLQAARYEELLARRAGQASTMGLNPAFIRAVMQAIHEESVRQQLELTAR